MKPRWSTLTWLLVTAVVLGAVGGVSFAKWGFPAVIKQLDSAVDRRLPQSSVGSRPVD